MNRIFLVGGRGAGKTTVGQLLADKRGWQFADVDEEVVRATGQSIATIFSASGESAFRDFEAEALVRLATSSTKVIATGGGIVLAKANRDLLTKHGLVVWLTATSAVMYQRITADPATATRRPNLTATGGLVEMETVLREREPLYREVANLIVDTTDLSPNEVVSAILAGCSFS